MVDEAYVYGSWAARYAGEPGPPPADIDVLVVGEADEDDLADAARSAEWRCPLGCRTSIILVRSGTAPYRPALGVTTM